MAGVSAQVGVGFGSMSLTLLVLVCMGMVGLLPSASAFSTGAALPLRQGASACKNAQKASLRPTTAARLFMQEQSPKEDEDKRFSELAAQLCTMRASGHGLVLSSRESKSCNVTSMLQASSMSGLSHFVVHVVSASDCMQYKDPTPRSVSCPLALTYLRDCVQLDC
eukprot:3930658-Rhodomonas_salina.1